MALQALPLLGVPSMGPIAATAAVVDASDVATEGGWPLSADGLHQICTQLPVATNDTA